MIMPTWLYASHGRLTRIYGIRFWQIVLKNSEVAAAGLR
jgi:hypothetical protein